MSRKLFINDPEVAFFNAIGKELIQEIVGQTITYFSVSDELTKSDELYGEAIRKTTFQPVEINARVLFQEPVQSVSQFTVDTQYSIEVYFQIYELNERGIVPKEGDFIKFGPNFYEIEKLVNPQIVYGEIEQRVEWRATCRMAREGQFVVSSESDGQ